MKKAPFALAITSLFLVAACDPDAPPRFIDAATPEWVNTITVDGVSKRRASLTNAAGQNFQVVRSGTDIGGGLIATRTNYKLYVADQNGVKCHWNSAETLTGCSKENPEWAAYQQQKKNPQAAP